MDVDELVADAQRYLNLGKTVAKRTLMFAIGVALLLVVGVSVLTGSAVAALAAAVVGLLPLLAIWLLSRDLDWLAGLPDQADDVWDQAKPELSKLLGGKKKRGGMLGLARSAKVGKALVGAMKGDAVGMLAEGAAHLNPARFGFAALAIASLPLLTFIGGLCLLLGLIF